VIGTDLGHEKLIDPKGAFVKALMVIQQFFLL
jgi:hypothetical protein